MKSSLQREGPKQSDESLMKASIHKRPRTKRQSAHWHWHVIDNPRLTSAQRDVVTTNHNRRKQQTKSNAKTHTHTTHTQAIQLNRKTTSITTSKQTQNNPTIKTTEEQTNALANNNTRTSTPTMPHCFLSIPTMGVAAASLLPGHGAGSSPVLEEELLQPIA